MWMGTQLENISAEPRNFGEYVGTYLSVGIALIVLGLLLFIAPKPLVTLAAGFLIIGGFALIGLAAKVKKARKYLEKTADEAISQA